MELDKSMGLTRAAELECVAALGVALEPVAALVAELGLVPVLEVEADSTMPVG
jgi:hypothetical protein